MAQIVILHVVSKCCSHIGIAVVRHIPKEIGTPVRSYAELNQHSYFGIGIQSRQVGPDSGH